MSTRNKKVDRRYKLTERRQTVGLRRTMVVSLLDAIRVGHLMPARAIATTAFHWPAPLGDR